MESRFNDPQLNDVPGLAITKTDRRYKRAETRQGLVYSDLFAFLSRSQSTSQSITCTYYYYYFIIIIIIIIIIICLGVTSKS